MAQPNSHSSGSHGRTSAGLVRVKQLWFVQDAARPKSSGSILSLITQLLCSSGSFEPSFAAERGVI